MDIRSMNHGIGIAEPLAERFAQRDVGNDRRIDCIHHQHFFGVDSAGSGAFADSKGIESGKRIGSELDAGADLTDLRRLLEDLDPISLARQYQCAGQPADATAGDQYR
jgi:hypothetical protein